MPKIEVYKDSLFNCIGKTLSTDELAELLPVAKAEGLGPSSELTMADGIVSQYYQLGERKPGDKLEFQLVGFKVPEPDRSWIVLTVVFGVVAVIVLWRAGKR